MSGRRTQYIEGQSSEEVIAENCEKFNTVNSDQNIIELTHVVKK